MTSISELLDKPTLSDRIKVEKSEADASINILEGIDGVSAKQLTTDEFDIPPTAILEVEVDLDAL